MTSIASRIFRGGDRRAGALLAFGGGSSESFWTPPSNLRRTGSFRDGGAPWAPPAGLARAHLVRGGGSVAGATRIMPRSVPGFATAMRTRMERGGEVGGAIRTMSSNKSKTKKRRGGRRRRKQGEHGGGAHDEDEAKSSTGASRRKRAAEDRLRGVMKSYRAMIDGHNHNDYGGGAESSSHDEGGGGDGGQVVIPPTQIVATASPHAWIASSAAEATGADLDPDFLFAHGGVSPQSFRSARFEYCSPKAFGHELPEFSIPEVAFLGRSNVGKSSLINALTGRRDLARVSKRPGRTQQVNYFALLLGAAGGDRSQGTPAAGRKARNASSTSSSAAAGTSSFHPSEAKAFLVDLPGFGYAAAPDEAVDAWQRTTMDFLLQRRDHGTMTRVYLLVDGRHGATPLDLTVMDWFDEAELPYTVVLTKTDSVSGEGAKLRHVNDLCLRFHGRLRGGGGGDDDGTTGVYMGPVVHLTSARTGDGIKDLMWAIDGDFVGYYEHARGAGGGEGAIVDSGKPGW